MVGVLADSVAGDLATISEDERVEAIEGLRVVDRCFLIQDSVNSAINELRPQIVVKGREHRGLVNAEEEILRAYGGELVFSSGESFLSASNLAIGIDGPHAGRHVLLPDRYLKHHQISPTRLTQLVDAMQSIRVLVVGDVILDEYVSCQTLGMSREDPTLVVTPTETHRFIGGAAIVAGHAANLGASVSLHSVAGNDEQAKYLRSELSALGVRHAVHEDLSRPTTTKQRFRAEGKTLLRVSHLHQDEISETLQDAVFNSVAADLKESDLVIFSDFNYGVLSQQLVERLTRLCKEAQIVMAADSQTSSQVGDISRFAGMDLLSPTEHEARVALRNFDDGLVVLADQLRDKAQAKLILMTLAEDGVFIRGATGESSLTTDRLPALNSSPTDVAGAGDAMLVVAAMSITAGATMHEAALLGSIGAALQVSATGNSPLQSKALLGTIIQ